MLSPVDFLHPVKAFWGILQENLMKAKTKESVEYSSATSTPPPPPPPPVTQQQNIINQIFVVALLLMYGVKMPEYVYLANIKGWSYIHMLSGETGPMATSIDFLLRYRHRGHSFLIFFISNVCYLLHVSH